MVVEDYLVRGVAKEGQIRVMAARTTRLAEEGRRRHGTMPVATAALGRLMTGTVMMGALLKRDERVLVQVCGDGPLGKVVAEADAAGHVRGYVTHPEVILPSTPEGKLPVGQGVGKGHLYVVKDLRLKEPYRGMVPLRSGEIAEDLAYYYVRSEQIPSAVALGVLVETDNTVRAAGGLMLQLMPGYDPALVPRLEAAVQGLPPISSLIDAGVTPEEILDRVMGELKWEELALIPLAFQCTCSREKLREILISLGKEEVAQLLQKEEGAEVVCQFCGEKYLFRPDELQEILAEAK